MHSPLLLITTLACQKAFTKTKSYLHKILTNPAHTCSYYSFYTDFFRHSRIKCRYLIQTSACLNTRLQKDRSEMKHHHGHGRRQGFGMGQPGRPRHGFGRGRMFGFGSLFRRSFFGRRPFGGCLTLPFISIFMLMAVFMISR